MKRKTMNEHGTVKDNKNNGRKALNIVKQNIKSKLYDVIKVFLQNLSYFWPHCWILRNR